MPITPLYLPMKFGPLLILCFFLVSCKNGCNQTKVNPQDSAIVLKVDSAKFFAERNNPMTADSIMPPSLKDTAKLDEYGKDSLRLGVAFQYAANEMCRVLKQKNAAAYVKFTPPAVLTKYGGEKKFMASLNRFFQEETGEVDRIVAGPIKRVAASTDDQGYSHGWYCLMPVRRFIRSNTGEVAMEMQWFGGQTLDAGKHIYFLNVTKVPRDKILSLMPDLRFVLDPEAEVQILP